LERIEAERQHKEHQIDLAEQELKQVKSEIRTDKLKSVATDAATALASGVSSLFGSGKMKSLERLAKQIGLSAMEFAELIKGRIVNFTGRLFSSEYNRWFATENTSLRILRDNDKLRQSIQQPIQPKKSRGMKI
jgi:hypothetical protein